MIFKIHFVRINFERNFGKIKWKLEKQGNAILLLTACENWAKEQGCLEFASDCELINAKSLDFHKSMGFFEANRIICFTKTI